MTAPKADDDIVWTHQQAAALTQALRWGTEAERRRALQLMDDADTPRDAS